MRTFVSFFLVVFILEAFGKAIVLANRDYERKPMHIAIDIFLVDGVVGHHSIRPRFLASSSLGVIAMAVAIFLNPNRS
jgi:hypothetical protein